jgi:flagellar assembly protein FliH
MDEGQVMDKLIRTLEISDQAIVLGLRRRPPAPEARAEHRPVAPAPRPEERAQRAIAEDKSDAAALQAEREKIRSELSRDLEARAQSVFDEAKSRGHEEGLALGKEEARREAERRHDAVAQTLAAVAERAEQEIGGAEDAVVGIAFEAICKILARDAVDRKAVRAMVQRVLSRAAQEEGVVVRLHPGDCAALRNGGKGLFPGRNGRVKVELVADEEVSLGGCIVETSGGSLDARIETQVEHLRDTLLKVRRGKSRKPRPKS